MQWLNRRIDRQAVATDKEMLFFAAGSGGNTKGHADNEFKKVIHVQRTLLKSLWISMITINYTIAIILIVRNLLRQFLY